MTARAIAKVTAAACFGLLTIALLVAWDSPAVAYESSIYAATPPLVWGILLFCLVSGTGIVVHQVYVAGHQENKLWLAGLLLVTLTVAAVLSLHATRGYLTNSAYDLLSDMSQAKHILGTGSIGSGNIYPATFILLSKLVVVAKVDLVKAAVRLFPVGSALLYILFMHILARRLFSDRGRAILVTLASCALVGPLPFNTFDPNIITDRMVPLALFCLVVAHKKVAGLPIKLSLLLLIFLFPISHPVPSIVLLVIMLTMSFPRRLLSRTRVGDAIDPGYNVITAATLVLLVWFYLWISDFGALANAVRNVQAIITEGGPSHLDELRRNILYAQAYGYSATKQFFRAYGGELVYAVLTFVSFLLLFRRTTSETELSNASPLYGPLVGIGLSMVTLFMFHQAFSPSRLMSYVMIICTVFAGVVLHEIVEMGRHSIRKRHRAGLYPFVVALILVSVSINGGLTLYPSSYVLAPNDHLTRTELQGYQWFLTQRHIDMPVLGEGQGCWRAAQLLQMSERNLHGKGPDRKIPWHFGYEESPMLGAHYSETSYMPRTKKQAVLYSDVWPEIAESRFVASDFEKLEHDRSVERLYSNTGFDVWLVCGVAQR